MIGLLDWLRPRWPVFAFLASAALLAGAHAFETFGGLKPCALCLLQRERHWIVLGVSVAAAFAALMFVRSERAQRIAAGVLFLAFAWSLYEGAHHVAVEQHWIAATCEGNVDTLGPIDLNGTFEAPQCDKPAWSLFGITMAGYNTLISFVLCVMSLAIAALPKGKTENV